MERSLMKINLGCASKILEGFINIDIRQADDRVHVDNVATLETIKDGSVDLIYACHVLEHFGRHEVMDVLRCWHNKLKYGGVLRLAVPDLEAACRLYIKEEYSLKAMYGLMYGGQMHEFDYHHIGFDLESLRALLIKAGFVKFKLWNWRQTEHSHIDDFSQAYLPHMDKENGTLMSLNLEAIK